MIFKFPLTFNYRSIWNQIGSIWTDKDIAMNILLPSDRNYCRSAGYQKHISYQKRSNGIL